MMADPTSVVCEWLNDGGGYNHADFDYGRIAMALEMITQASALRYAGEDRAAQALEDLLVQLGMYDEAKARYSFLDEWRRLRVVRLPEDDGDDHPSPSGSLGRVVPPQPAKRLRLSLRRGRRSSA